jgi:phenylalanyl-tRNA synthetase beta chain
VKVSKKWLNDYVSVADISSLELAERLTIAGLEVEGIETLACQAELVIGEVLTCDRHPDSDHLSVTTVNLGDKVEQIVCGAPNVAQGQKVIVARLGAVLPQLTIKKAVVRGFESCGMICSLNELGVDEKFLRPDSGEGIEVLGDDAIVGENPLVYLGLDDEILDVKQTPNRADFNALWNVAKEVGAIFNRPVTWPDCECAASVGKETTLVVRSETAGCSLFLGKVINKLVVKESPRWLKERLMAGGVKPINNVVDISNFVMMETGQPLHFYDLAKMSVQEITVMDQSAGKLVALDENEYDLLDSDLVITSAGKVIGIAGVMGGDDSKIDESTTGIIIEAASFSPVSIRNTSRRLDLITEAASRFTKGIEPLAPYKALDRAVQLLIEMANADDIEATVQFGEVNHVDKEVKVTCSHVNALLGTSLSMEEVVDALKRLHLRPMVNGDEITTTIPSFRTDLLIAQDLIEEVIRMVGYQKIEATLPLMPQTIGLLNDQQVKRRSIQRILTSLGLQEVVTYTLVKESLLEGVLPMADPIALASPLSEDRKYVRNNVSMSVLEVVAYNQAHKNGNFNVFELSQVYGKGGSQWRLSVALSGELLGNPWAKQRINGDFYALKGLLESVFAQLGFEGSRLRWIRNEVDHKNFQPYRSAVVMLGKEVLAVFGDVHPTLAKSKGIKNVVMAEVMLDVLLAQSAAKIKFVASNKYPKVVRDVALITDARLEVEVLVAAINRGGKPLVQSVEVFDIFTSDELGWDKKSVALTITYQAKDHTLTEEEVSMVHGKILEHLAKAGAVLR